MNSADLRARLAKGEAVLIALPDRAHFRLTGSDRVRYLNGQVSNDVRKATSDEALPACVMNAKGKMNGLIWITAGPDALHFDSEGELAESLALRLERYIISDDAELADVTDTFTLFHCLGPLPAHLPDGCAAIRSRRYGMEGTDLRCSAGAEAIAFGLPVVPEETVEVFRIEQGIPKWGAELDENTLPAEAGLDDTAIDFHKGCYIGQEIVSRSKSVGRVNQKLTGLISETILPPGTPVQSNDKESGEITSSAWSFALEKAVSLGYLKRGMEEAALTADGQPVKIRPLPLSAD